MSQLDDQFREVFAAHEHLAPHMGAVYLGSQALYRKYMRRRRGAQVVGGAVLGAGLFAAGTNLPASLLPGAAPPVPTRISTPPMAVPSSVPTSLSPAELTRDLAAFDQAGYGYDDAAELATLWHTGAKVGYVKAEAGRLLLAGQTLPIRPHPDPSAAASAAAVAFGDAGYTSEDAARLAEMWHLNSPSDAKVAGGTKLEAGKRLPFPARLGPRDRFWAAGYDVADAEKLAHLWHVSVDEAKTEAGRRLIAGKDLPIGP